MNEIAYTNSEIYGIDFSSAEYSYEILECDLDEIMTEENEAEDG